MKPNPAECVWEISGKFDSRGCPEIQYCKDIDRDKVICLDGHCVECITNADCLITEPICQNNVCVPCPDGMKYDKEKKECVCPTPTETVCNESALTYDTNGCPLNKYEPCTEPKTECAADNKTCICPTCSDPNNMIQDINCNCTCNTTKGFVATPENGKCVCPTGYVEDSNGNCVLEVKVGDPCDENIDCNYGSQMGKFYCQSPRDCSKKTGTCQLIGTPIIGEKSGFICSDHLMGYWAAHNWCQANGRKLVSTTDFNCANEAGKEGTAQHLYCNSSSGQLSDIMQKNIDDFEGKLSFWQWTETNTYFGCMAYAILPSGMMFYAGDKNSYTWYTMPYHALCK